MNTPGKWYIVAQVPLASLEEQESLDLMALQAGTVLLGQLDSRVMWVELVSLVEMVQQDFQAA